MAVAAVPEVPGFKALSPLGAGPSSSIFSAHSEDLGRWVALTVYASKIRGERGRNRFQRAYELTRRLGVHPHTVTALDHGVAPDGRPYVVTEFYEHGTFESRVTGDQPLPIDKTLRIGVSLAGALETAHRAEVVHGGVHPARILADSDDEPSLADTGLVPLVEPSGPEALLGPVNYHAPPEVLEEDTWTPATDVYSLASTLYTLLTGCAPYSSSDREDTSAALLLRVLRHEVPPIPRPDIPPSLTQALYAALHSDPRRRPGTVLAFAQSLQAAQREIGAPVTQPVLLDIPPGLVPGGEVAADSVPLPPFPAPAPAAPPEVEPPPVGPDPAPGRGVPDEHDLFSQRSQPAPPPEQQAFIPYPPPAPPAPPGLDAEPEARRDVEPPLQPEPQPMERLLVADPPSPSSPPEPPDPSNRELSWASAWLPSDAAPPPHVEDVDADGEPFHQRLASPNPWLGPTAASGIATSEAVDSEVLDVAAEHEEDAPASSQPAAPVRPARGPRALPLIVLGAIVLMLLVGAVWMVISGSNPSDASGTGEAGRLSEPSPALSVSVHRGL